MATEMSKGRGFTAMCRSRFEGQRGWESPSDSSLDSDLDGERKVPRRASDGEGVLSGRDGVGLVLDRPDGKVSSSDTVGKSCVSSRPRELELKG